MEMTSTKKKLMLAAILTSGLTFAISQAALADQQTDTTDKQAETPYQAFMKPEMRKAHEKFLDDTVAIRKELAEKNAVLRALMQAGTPDTVKASQMAGEVFELREKLRVKAREAGLSMPMGYGNTSGYCDGYGDHGMRGKRFHRTMQ